MASSTKSRYQIAAYLFTGICLLTTVILGLFIVFGPKEGMEAMVIIIPWYLAGAAHLTIGIAAIICALATRSFLKNSWIYLYFLLFFGINGYYLAIINQVDVAIERKIDTITSPQETELYGLLRNMHLQGMTTGAVDVSSLQRARLLVQSGADLTYVLPGKHESMIVMAASSGDPELVRLMLDKRIDVNGSVSGSETPLMRSVSGNHSDVLKLLLDNGADPDDARYTARLPLMIAAKQGNLEITDFLLEAGANPDRETSSSQPALLLAAGEGFTDVVKSLLDHGANPNVVAFGNTTPMLRAVMSNCVACVQALVDAGGNSNGSRAGSGETPLILAIKNDARPIIEILRSAESGPGSAADLFYADKKGDPELLKLLLEFGVDPDGRDDSGDTLLMKIATRNKYRGKTAADDAATAEVLLTHGADPNLFDKHQTTALFRAAQSGNTAVGLALIKNDANVNLSDKDGKSPLFLAAGMGNLNLAAALLEAGADPNATVNWGMNSTYPLKPAVRQNDVNMVKLLLDGGATIDPASRDLCDLISYGAQSPEIIRLLVDTGVDLNQRDPLHRYPLNEIMRKGSPESVAYLLAHGAKPILSDWKGEQPFMRLVKSGQAEMVAATIKNVPAIREDQKQMRDAMYWAIRSAHADVVRVLLEEGLFFSRLDEVKAILAWAKSPPATPEEKEEIFQLFKQRIQELEKPAARNSSPILKVLPGTGKP